MKKAILFIVATPIGNLDDITLRALNVLSNADAVACESPRHSQHLLNSYEINTLVIPLSQVINYLSQGKTVALVSSAGTPAISDPGCKIVAQARKIGFNIVPIPGPSALIALASVSGLPVSRFLFLGFIPKKKGRQKFFKKINQSEYTVVFYESKHRIKKTLNQLKESLDNKKQHIVVGRELTKMHETIYQGTIDQVLTQLKKTSFNGEFVVAIEPAN